MDTKFTTTTISISGITCDACLKLIKRRVGSIGDVVEVNVDQTGVTAIIAYRTITKDEIIDVLKGTHYQVE